MTLASAPPITSPPNRGTRVSRVLYITLDGALEPLGQTQVVPYVIRLADHGYQYSLISFEREHDADPQAVAALQERLSRSCVQWTPLPYRPGGVRNVLANCRAMFIAARQIVADNNIELIHARAFVPAAIALLLKLTRGVPYVFDMRAYWVDERAVEKQWFTNRFAYAIGKWLERQLVRNAAGVITLTKLQADDLRRTRLADFASVPLAVIPTCTDFERFGECAQVSALPPELTARLEGKLVVGMIGSVNASYYPAESARLFRKIAEKNPGAHLLGLTRQKESLEPILLQEGLQQSQYTIATAQHSEMASWMRRMNWAFLLLVDNFAKRGSMPTKMAELFASGVRTIAFGCNAEFREWAAKNGSVVLSSLDDSELDRAATLIANSGIDRNTRLPVSSEAREHFDLSNGVQRYERLLNQVFKHANSGKL
jgi:glycosyltransferase involved in cell wall biosynthesis